MRRDNIIAIVTATLIAIGVALASGFTATDPERLDDFVTIVYVRDVEHGRERVFGECPLAQEITIDRSGKVEIGWRVQTPEHHGCERVIDWREGIPDEILLEEAVIARREIMLDKSARRQVLDALNGLKWDANWQVAAKQTHSFTTGCERRHTFTFPGRILAAVKPGERVANLWIYGDRARYITDNPGCVASHIANAAILDAAVAPFAPDLPESYHLRPNIAAQLIRGP